MLTAIKVYEDCRAPDESEEKEAVFDASCEAEHAFARTPAQTTAGLLFKLEQLESADFNAPSLAEGVMKDARRLLASA